MNARVHPTNLVGQNVQSHYLPALDGLRFIAFMLVFIHHLPLSDFSETLYWLKTYGWVGVELFFVISSYLFFYLLRAEQEKTGRISFSAFYLRRFLRLYPLMAAFPIGMYLIYGFQDEFGFARLAGILLFSDNLITWVKGYNFSIMHTAHLWTLSFEFQVYLIMPLAFAIYSTRGRSRLVQTLIAVLVFSFVLRATFFALGSPHPVIWATPFLRPESVVAGMLLALLAPRWHWSISAALSAASGWVFFTLPSPWDASVASALQYPIAAIMCVFLVDATLRSPLLSSALSVRPMKYLGARSFGLYVFHTFAIAIAVSQAGRYAWTNSSTQYVAIFSLSLIMTMALAAISYPLVEKPFLKIKKRFTYVPSRPI